ncbi:hypothetical protein MC885_000026 [Smutsia gigantea]|nr:hypothetical protein MC885_000026 [Smutsia gigantea]
MGPVIIQAWLLCPRSGVADGQVPRRIGPALYILYLAYPAQFNPDVNCDRNNLGVIWNKLGPNDQYRFYSVNADYSKPKKEDGCGLSGRQAPLRTHTQPAENGPLVDEF